MVEEPGDYRWFQNSDKPRVSEKNNTLSVRPVCRHNSVSAPKHLIIAAEGTLVTIQHFGRSLLSISFTVFLLLTTSNPTIKAQHQSPKTVVDYFLALPDRYAGETTREERNQLVSDGSGRVITKDIKNGYLAISGDAGSPGFIVAIFKKPDGKYLVGVNPYFEMGEDFFILSSENGKWMNFTQMVIPGYNPKLHYVLPQYGTTIKVQNQAEKDLYELVWKGGQFVKK